MKFNKFVRAPYLRKRREEYITVTFECPRDLHKKIKHEATLDSRSLSAWLRAKLKILLEQES